MSEWKQTNDLFRKIAVLFLAAYIWTCLDGNAFCQKQGAEESPGFSRARNLAGQWVRPDGGYVLVLESIQSDGGMKASYFNPGRINVHESFWRLAEDKLYVFVELRDVNYPGSKYALSYDENNDVLTGVYFQAAVQQRFEVYFARSR